MSRLWQSVNQPDLDILQDIFNAENDYDLFINVAGARPQEVLERQLSIFQQELIRADNRYQALVQKGTLLLTIGFASLGVLGWARIAQVPVIWLSWLLLASILSICISIAFAIIVVLPMDEVRMDTEFILLFDPKDHARIEAELSKRIEKDKYLAVVLYYQARVLYVKTEVVEWVTKRCNFAFKAYIFGFLLGLWCFGAYYMSGLL